MFCWHRWSKWHTGPAALVQVRECQKCGKIESCETAPFLKHGHNICSGGFVGIFSRETDECLKVVNVDHSGDPEIDEVIRYKKPVTVLQKTD